MPGEPFIRLPARALAILEDASLGSRGLALYVILLSYQGANAACRASRVTLAHRLGISERRVGDYLNRLVDGGWIHRVRRGPGRAAETVVMVGPDRTPTSGQDRTPASCQAALIGHPGPSRPDAGVLQDRTPASSLSRYTELDTRDDDALPPFLAGEELSRVRELRSLAAKLGVRLETEAERCAAWYESKELQVASPLAAMRDWLRKAPRFRRRGPPPHLVPEPSERSAADGWQAWRDQAEPLDVASRLAALAVALPEVFPGREELAERILRLEGDSATVEEALRSLDREMLQLALQALPADQRADLDAAVAQGLVEAAARLPPEDLEAERARSLARLVRLQLELPVLSLV